MADKQDAPSAAFDLPSWQVLEASGADAATFLQAQTMNDMRPLEPGRWQWNGWLTPKGRVIALFALAMIEAERFWIVLPDVSAGDLATRLQRFVFRSKVKLRALDDATVSGAFAAPARALGSAFDREVRDSGERLEFDMGAEGGPRTLRIETTAIATAETVAEASSANADRWTAFDLAHGLPHLAPDQGESWTPQMLSLERLKAFSVKKGCYPGQEIVARTHFLGQAKRGLVRIVGNVPATGSEVRMAGQAVGTIVSRTGNEALAVMPREWPEGIPEIDGHDCRCERLFDGLAR